MDPLPRHGQQLLQGSGCRATWAARPTPPVAAYRLRPTPAIRAAGQPARDPARPCTVLVV